MASYPGFFIRDGLGQQPGQQADGPASPDIILAGTCPAPDPGSFATPRGYATDYGSAVYPGVPNFVYLRTLPPIGRAWFYWAPRDLVPWPQSWQSAGVTVAGAPCNHQDLTLTAAGQVCVTDPYAWQPAPSKGCGYSFLAWIENRPAEPPQDPVAAFGPAESWERLIAFQSGDGDWAWRNVVDVSGLGVNWSQSVDVTGPTDVPGVFIIGLQCTNMPTDGELGFVLTSPANGGSGANFPLSPIPEPNYRGAVEVTDWPGGAAASLTVNYRQGAVAPPKGAGIEAVLAVPIGNLSAEVAALAAARPDRLITDTGIEMSFIVGALVFRF